MDRLSENVCLAIDHDKQFQTNVDECCCGLGFTCKSVTLSKQDSLICVRRKFCEVRI